MATGDKSRTVTWTPTKVHLVMEMIERYVIEHGDGEMIAQSDKATIDGISLLIDIADVIAPDVWTEK